jgi:hypothetical protein
MRLNNYLKEEKVVGLLGKKLAKLKKEHGYISKSMLTKKELEQLKKSGGKLAEASRQGPSAIDGKSKQAAKNAILKATQKFTRNKLYKDDYWRGPNDIFKVFDEELNVSWHLEKTEYRKRPEDDMPTSKVWDYTITFVNNKGKEQKIGGQVIASGAGSVKDPLDRYDVVVTVW